MISKKNIQSILIMQSKRNEQYWMIIDISRQLSHDTVADKEIAAKYKTFLLVYPPRNRGRCMRGWTIGRRSLKYFTEIARKVEEPKAWGNRKKWRRRRRRRRNRDKKKGLPVCQSELCERNDVNTRLCRSSMQRLPKSAGCGQGGFAGNREGQIKSTRDLRT